MKYIYRIFHVFSETQIATLRVSSQVVGRDFPHLTHGTIPFLHKRGCYLQGTLWLSLQQPCLFSPQRSIPSEISSLALDDYESWVVPAGVPSALADIGGRVEANY